MKYLTKYLLVLLAVAGVMAFTTPAAEARSRKHYRDGYSSRHYSRYSNYRSPRYYSYRSPRYYGSSRYYTYRRPVVYRSYGYGYGYPGYYSRSYYSRPSIGLSIGFGGRGYGGYGGWGDRCW
jgi:hypothetical protein